MSAVGDVVAEIFGSAADLSVERETEGVSTIVYRITRGAERFFLRLAEEPDENLEVDALVHERLLAIGVRVPRVVHVVAHEPRLGRSIMITTDIGGLPLSHSTDPRTRVAIVERAGEDVAVINSERVDGFGWILRDAPVWPPCGELEDYASFVIDELPNPWPGRFADLFPAGDLEQIEACIRDESERTVDHAVLAHGDLGLDHIFEHHGDYMGIIDFGELRGTEPEFDLGVFYNHTPREDRAAVLDAMLRGYQRVAPLPEDIRRRMSVSGMLKTLRQLGRWLHPDFPHQRDPAALAAIVSRRFLPALRAQV